MSLHASAPAFTGAHLKVKRFTGVLTRAKQDKALIARNYWLANPAMASACAVNLKTATAFTLIAPYRIFIVL
jgi:hypothetical protein